MKKQDAFADKNDLKRPPVLVFIAAYICALVVSLKNDPANTLASVGISAGLLLLCWFVIWITENTPPAEVATTDNGWGLLVAMAILLTWALAPLPRVDFGDRWQLGLILKKCVILVVIPVVVMMLRRTSSASLGLTTRGWRRDCLTGAAIFVVMVIPSAFYGPTARQILSGKLGVLQIAIGLPASFAYYLVMAGFPEEFFFRAFFQTRLTAIFRSKMAGVLIASLLFGMIHISGMLKSDPSTSLVKAFVATFFVQTFIGIVFGVIWERTRSLIPCVLVHTGIDAVNNLDEVVSILGL